jgi:hypothetical protein
MRRQTCVNDEASNAPDAPGEPAKSQGEISAVPVIDDAKLIPEAHTSIHNEVTPLADTPTLASPLPILEGVISASTAEEASCAGAEGGESRAQKESDDTVVLPAGEQEDTGAPGTVGNMDATDKTNLVCQGATADATDTEKGDVVLEEVDSKAEIIHTEQDDAGQAETANADTSTPQVETHTPCVDETRPEVLVSNAGPDMVNTDEAVPEEVAAPELPAPHAPCEEAGSVAGPQKGVDVDTTEMFAPSKDMAEEQQTILPLPDKAEDAKSAPPAPNVEAPCATEDMPATPVEVTSEQSLRCGGRISSEETLRPTSTAHWVLEDTIQAESAQTSTDDSTSTEVPPPLERGSGNEAAVELKLDTCVDDAEAANTEPASTTEEPASTAEERDTAVVESPAIEGLDSTVKPDIAGEAITHWPETVVEELNSRTYEPDAPTEERDTIAMESNALVQEPVIETEVQQPIGGECPTDEVEPASEHVSEDGILVADPAVSTPPLLEACGVEAAPIPETEASSQMADNTATSETPPTESADALKVAQDVKDPVDEDVPVGCEAADELIVASDEFTGSVAKARHPGSSWTPSYSATSQGISAFELFDQGEVADVEQLVRDAGESREIAEEAAVEAQDTPCANAGDSAPLDHPIPAADSVVDGMESTTKPKSSWTPSYAVSMQGSPRLDSAVVPVFAQFLAVAKLNGGAEIPQTKGSAVPAAIGAEEDVSVVSATHEVSPDPAPIERSIPEACLS